RRTGRARAHQKAAPAQLRSRRTDEGALLRKKTRKGPSRGGARGRTGAAIRDLWRAGARADARRAPPYAGQTRGGARGRTGAAIRDLWRAGARADARRAPPYAGQTRGGARGRTGAAIRDLWRAGARADARRAGRGGA